jgi:hypothetical protein
MEEMAFELPRAKKEVWDRSRVVTVIAVGGRSMRAGGGLVYFGGGGRGEGLHKKKNCRRKRRKRGMFWARVCVMRKSDVRSNSATA